MDRILRVLVVAAAVVIVGGLVAVGLSRGRHAAVSFQCQNNLKQIGLTIDNYHDALRRYPRPAARSNGLSWLVPIFPLIEARPGAMLDAERAWDDPVNCPPRDDGRVKFDPTPREPREVGMIVCFQCPGGPPVFNPGQTCRTHYVGVAGAGESAAALPLTDRRAGFFGHDRTLTRDDVKDGASNTFAVVEATDGGPWTAGGWATVRGMAPPYLAPGGPFGGTHRDGTNAAFADGSVRAFSRSTAPEVLEAHATVAGGD